MDKNQRQWLLGRSTAKAAAKAVAGGDALEQAVELLPVPRTAATAGAGCSPSPTPMPAPGAVTPAGTPRLTTGPGAMAADDTAGEAKLFVSGASVGMTSSKIAWLFGIYSSTQAVKVQFHSVRDVHVLSSVRVVSRSIPPPWGPIRFRLAPRTYAPWGLIVRVVPGRLTKSRKIPTRNMLPLFFF